MTDGVRTELSVVIDSVVRMREAQVWAQPDAGALAAAAIGAGADGVLLSLYATHVAARDRSPEMLGEFGGRLCVAATLQPILLQATLASAAQQCVIIPGARHEHSSGGSLAVQVVREALLSARALLAQRDIEVAARIDPELEAVECCHELGLRAVEFNTARYALAARRETRERRFAELSNCAAAAREAGMRVSLRGGLNFDNVGAFAMLEGVSEVRVGQALIAAALFDGIQTSIAKMRGLLGGRTQ